MKPIIFIVFLMSSIPVYAENLTERSFFFLWPSQDSRDAQLNLDEPLVTDRPDFTEASSTVGKNVLQIESGYTFSHQKNASDSSSEHSYPEILMRKGLFVDWLELRLGTNYLSQELGSDLDTAHDDLYTGLKLGILPQQGVLPELSIFPQMVLPTGGVGNDQVLPGVNFSYAWSIFADSYLGANTQINRSLEEGELFTEYSQSIALGTSLTEDLGGYIEWFAFFSEGQGIDDLHFLSGGLTYNLNKDIMIDLRYGHSLEHHTESFFIGTGLSARFFTF